MLFLCPIPKKSRQLKVYAWLCMTLPTPERGNRNDQMLEMPSRIKKVGLPKRTGLQQTEQDDLNHQDRWDTDGELQFPCFMMKEVHTCQRPDAAAGGGQDEQCFLRNPH